jgi:magnesium and cobalt transporter
MRDPGSTHRAAATLLRQLCLLGGLALAALAAQHTGWPPSASLAAVGLAVAGVLLLEVVLGRMLALWNPRATLRFTAPLVVAAHVTLYPIVRPLCRVADWIAPPRPVSEDEREEEQEEKVDALIEVGKREGFLEANEGEMMRSIADLDATIVREIMTPRTDIVALSEATTVAEARRVVLEAGHSRIPVFHESIDNVIGVLHERDLLRASAENRDDDTIAPLARPVIFVPETLTVAELLAEMKLRKHVGLVVDEYGGLSGLVTLEDVLEEIVGDIRDEHDEEEPLVRSAEDGSFIIDAAAHVEELEERFGLTFGERDFDTVGGLVVTLLGRVPAAGETLLVQDLTIEVLEADGRRIRLVRVRPPEPAGEARVGP